MIKRRISKTIQIGDVTIGGGGPIIVQSMTNSDTRNAAATIDQIKQLQEAGCELVRVAVPDMQAAEALKAIIAGIDIPLVSDIHFDYRLALAAIKAGVHGLRLNPGNISEPDKVKAVVEAAKERSVPIRIGVNGGSLPKERDTSIPVSQQMVAAAMGQIRLLESLDFDLIKISLKAFDVPTTIDAYVEIADKIPYPLHIGITEAGTPHAGIIRSSVGIGSILAMGLGDTIRVSLTAHPVEEIFAAYEILKSLDLRQRGPVMVSCPSCGRCQVDLIGLANQVEERLKETDRPVKVAVMGCIVNGPGEARDADIGVACGRGRAVIFKNGEQLRVVEESEILDSLMSEIERL